MASGRQGDGGGHALNERGKVAVWRDGQFIDLDVVGP
jgi:hypothetical protein